MNRLKNILSFSLAFLLVLGVTFSGVQPGLAADNGVIIDFVGAYPAGPDGQGRPAPDISQVPITGNTDIYFALAFARDQTQDKTSTYNGNFEPYWDTWSTYGLTKERIQELKNGNGHRKFLVSVGGGDNYPWQDPANLDDWVNKASASLTTLMQDYHLDGIDLNYENNLTPTFVTAWNRVLTNLKTGNPNLVVTITPFGATWNPYKELYTKNPNNITYINYQIYADISAGQKQAALDKYQALSNEVGGYGKLTLGAATSTTSPRGLTLAESNEVLRELMTKGVRGAFIWSAEDSAQANYEPEKTFQATLNGTPPPPTEGVTFHEHINYEGQATKPLPAGDYNLDQLTSNGFVNDWASSVKIPEGYTVQIFEHDNFQGLDWLLTKNDDQSKDFTKIIYRPLWFLTLNVNDRVSSVKIKKGVTFYEHMNYEGNAAGSLLPGDYTLAQLQSNGFTNDWASSVTIPDGYSVQLFEEDNFGGRSWTLTQNASNSRNFVILGANDAISSVKVIKN